jgi:predicted 3-demethylubiquinone-9 3-methyltransferase (glyoxalase superfamily)
LSEQKITPCLWFNFNAEQAVAHYLSIFPESRIVALTHYGDGGPGPKGAVMTILFEIEGERVLALNGGPQFSFTPAISLIVNCETQGEVDRLWDGLCEGGKPGRCGWLTDKFGVSWQIVPSIVPKIMRSGDEAAIGRAIQMIMPMTKLDFATLQEATWPSDR